MSSDRKMKKHSNKEEYIERERINSLSDLIYFITQQVSSHLTDTLIHEIWIDASN